MSHDPASRFSHHEADTLVAGAAGALMLDAEGEIDELTAADARRRWEAGPAPLVCHAPSLRRRIGARDAPAFDVLELWAFVRPAEFCVPTPRGLAQALGIVVPHDLADQALAVRRAAQMLLDDLRGLTDDERADAAAVAAAMTKGGWAWAGAILTALGLGSTAQPALDVWRRIGEWDETAPRTPPGHQPIAEDEVRLRLAQLLGEGAEARPQQADYAVHLTSAFLPRERAGHPHAVLAEAGTGVGKTLGYIAPASVWAQKNDGAVWISTFTKNLQRQVDQELDRLFPDPAAKARRVVVRKGRENYLCLLNLDNAVSGYAGRASETVALGLVARWAAATRDGDMVGGDFPSWLTDLLGMGRTLALTDRRGECIYSACPHYRRCYIERSIRKARRADMVVANHALVLVQAAMADDDSDGLLPTRYVFDEGHHLFDAADGAFSAHITGLEGAELRRWILGAEGRRTRARGLERRLADLIDDEGLGHLDAALKAARCLPAEGWRQRLVDETPLTPAERFLAHIRRQVLARVGEGDRGYGLECPVTPPVDGLIEAARVLDGALQDLIEPLLSLARNLKQQLDDDADTLETATRARMEAMIRGLKRRGLVILAAWRRMLAELEIETPEQFVDWFSLDRVDGRELDVGMHRHWRDPGLPFANHVAERSHGLVITSATLRDRAGDEADDDWDSARLRTGLRHLVEPALTAEVPSPFDYARQTRVVVVTDVGRNQPDQVAAAYRELFKASGGGALGLFTAIARLRQVHKRIAADLDHAGLTLYAQHVDAMDTGTLVDIFRAETDACLLGTDAVRDGVDVPGRSLRLVVFDRVPWPRPDILHKARREVFGGNRYDDLITRLRLRQAFGRLVRRADDKGVFVMLDSALPTRLTSAFPAEVGIERIGLAEAIASISKFLAESA